MNFSHPAARRLCLSLLACSSLFLTALPAWSADAPTGAAGDSAKAAAVVETVSSLSNIPAPNLGATAWLTLDANSGQVIGSLNADDPVEPASLTKLMSTYVMFEALDSGRLKLDQKVHVSEKAWKTEGSRMFINPNTDVSVEDLLQGVIVQSGNDATVALAEAVAGSTSAFVALMNEQAKVLGLKHTHFMNVDGLPDPQHVTTVRDLAVMSRALEQHFPQYMHYYSQKDFTYNKIKQSNRNRLLWVDQTVDGLKTGHTQAAGFCLVATALRDGRRVISVLVGAASDSARTEGSLKLLNWSFQNFDTVKLLDKDQSAVSARVWEGTADKAELGVTQALWVTVPRGKSGDIKSQARYTQPLMAPLKQGDRAGTLLVSLDDKVLKQVPLTVLKSVDEAGLFGRMVDKVRLLFH